MKRTLLFLLMLFAVTWANAQSNLTLSEAKEIANTYYGSLQQMAKHPIGDVAAESEIRLLNVLGFDNHGRALFSELRVPDDLVDLSGKHPEDDNSIPVTTYIGAFLKIAGEKKIDFSYKVLSADYQPGRPEVYGEVPPLYARVMVQKTIKSPRSTTVLINDTMIIHAEKKYITKIKNRYLKLSMSNIDGMSIDELLFEAQSMYSNRRYDEAYKLYQKALEKDPKNAEASYSLGVMSFKGEGCKQYPRKVRDYLVVFYWQKSEKGIVQLEINRNELNVRMRPFSGRESNPFPSNRLFAYNYKTEKLGYISAQGKMVIKQQYQYGYPFFTNGTAIVKSEKNEWFLIDTMGRVKEFFQDVRELRGSKQLLILRYNNGKGVVGVINRNTGVWDIPFFYWIASSYWIEDETKCFKVKKDEKYGVVSPKNDILVPLIYNNLNFVTHTMEGIIILCDYDESLYDQLLKKYENASKIPNDELKKIGTLLTINVNY